MQIRSRMCAREFNSDDRPDLYAGTPPLEALKAIISIAANHKEMFFHHAHRRVTCVFPCEGPETSADTIACGEQNGHRRWKSGIDEERACTEQGTRPAIGSEIGKRMSRTGDSKLDSALRICFTMEGIEFFGMTHGDDFVSCGSSESIKTLNRMLHWGRRAIVLSA